MSSRKPAPSKRGRPSFKPTEEQRKTVQAMAAYSVPQDKIAKVIGVDGMTLRKYFRDELDKSEIKMLTSVKENLYAIARSKRAGAGSACMFILKCRDGWRDTPQMIEIGGTGGGPIELQVKGDKRTRRF